MAKLEENLRIFPEQASTDSTVALEKAMENYIAFEKFKEEHSKYTAGGFS